MIKNIKIENFYSIGKEQEISFEVSPKDIIDDSSLKVDSKTSLNLVSCFIGHNASGKTNALKAVVFIFWIIKQSYENLKKDQYLPFRAHRLREDKNSKIEIEFINNGKTYKHYIEFNSKEILKEYLGINKTRGFSRIFELNRTARHTKLQFGDNLSVNAADKKRIKGRNNISILSSLIAMDYITDFDIFKNYKTNIDPRYGYGYDNDGSFKKFFSTSDTFSNEEGIKNEVLAFTKNIDVGISNFRISKFDISSSTEVGGTTEQSILSCEHTTKKSTFLLPLIDESHGTQSAFYILKDIFLILKTGGIAILDEMDTNLHPLLVKKIISLFEKKETNKSNAQLVFSTHQHLLLNDRSKTQIFIAEKTLDTLETEVYRLDDIEGIRNDENFFQKYMSGVYGGTPRIKWF